MTDSPSGIDLHPKPRVVRITRWPLIVTVLCVVIVLAASLYRAETIKPGEFSVPNEDPPSWWEFFYFPFAFLCVLYCLHCTASIVASLVSMLAQRRKNNRS